MIIPSVTKKENQEWLLQNSEVFMEYMASHHSLVDIVHTYLNYETFDDAYVEKMIKEIELYLKKKDDQEKKIKLIAKKKYSKTPTVVEKKMEKFNKIAEKAENQDDFLLDE